MSKRNITDRHISRQSIEIRKKHKVGFESNGWYNGSEKHLADARRGGEIAVANKTTGMQTLSTCPWCRKTGQVAIMGRWHFDNCKMNPSNLICESMHDAKAPTNAKKKELSKEFLDKLSEI